MEGDGMLPHPRPPQDAKEVPPPPKRPWVKKALIAGGILLLMGLGAMAGVLIWRATRPSSSSGAAKPMQVQQLPPPGSPAALALLADPNTSKGIRDLYQAVTDANTITANNTAAWLKELQTQLLPMGYKVDLELFIDLAAQVLDLLRRARSDVLLPLLRQYAVNGTLVLEGVDQDVLQREVQSLLQNSAWGEYFRQTSVRDHPHSSPTTQTTPAATSNSSETPATGAAGGRRLLLRPFGKPHTTGGPGYVITNSHNTTTSSSSTLQRRLKAVHVMPSIPEEGDVTSTSGEVLPTEGPLLTLDDMMCSIASYRPRPPDTSACRLRPTSARFKHGDVSFAPIEVPLVFHGMRYVDSSSGSSSRPTLLPPYLDATITGPSGTVFRTAQEDAAHLVEVTNQLYRGSGISFRLKEVRTDPERYPYLLVDGGLDAWQACAPYSEGYNKECWTAPVENMDTSLAINVFLAGSRMPGLCAAGKPCNRHALGICECLGPWFGEVSDTWREANMQENWVWMLYEYFAGHYHNKASVWDGGAVTLAHELGHYLGLRHTFQQECAGDGLAAADAVPDTPMQRDINKYSNSELDGMLGAFCSNWRYGKAVRRRVLRQFNSCSRRGHPQGNDVIDNVFNIMSYLPDQCSMVFTPNQVARLQWATATYRPQMMARYAA